MKSQYVYKVVEPAAYLRGRFGKKFFLKINAQIAEMGEQGWDYYKEIGMNGLVFRKLREEE